MVKLIKHLKKLPTLVLAGSFLSLAALTTLTNPDEKLIYSVLFFFSLLTFLVSSGHILTSLNRKPSSATKTKTVIISLFIVVALMFRSSQSLSWVDGLILFLTVIGTIFYADRRFSG